MWYHLISVIKCVTIRRTVVSKLLVIGQAAKFKAKKIERRVDGQFDYPLMSSRVKGITLI